jgi:translocation and assembly module TamB
MTDTPEAKQPEVKPRRLRFWLLTALAIIVLLPLLLIGMLFLALRSETGTAWVIDQIPGLEVRQGQGSLLGRWHAESLNWQGFGVGVQVRAPFIDWSPSCFAGKEFCLDTLEAGSIDLTLQSSEKDPSPGDISLPELDLPISVTIRSVNLGPFTLNQNPIWDRLQLSAEGSGADWTISSLSVQRETLSLDVSGRLQTRRDWPLDLTVKLDLPPPYGDQWLLDLNLTGSVADLLIRGRSEGYLNAQLSGRTQPLQSALPAQLRVQAERFLATESLPKTLTLLNADVSVKGSLAKGFQTDATSQLPGNQGKIGLALKGLVTTTGVQALDLRLSGQGTGDAKTGTASVTGDMSWEDAFAVKARVALEAFPWFNLLPGVEAPPVTLDRLTGDVVFEKGVYDAKLEAIVDGPLGKTNLASSIKGDQDALELSKLRVNTGAGFLGGQAKIGFADQLSWQANLELSQFNPGYWVPELEASLNGEVTSKGQLQEEGLPSAQASWNLQGSWRASEAVIQGTINHENETLTLSGLDFRVDDNRIVGQGTWGPELSGEFELTLPQPDLFLDDLGGVMNGRVSVSGTPDQPQGNLSLTGTGLAWQDQVAVEKLDLTAAISEGNNLDGDLSVTSIKGGGQSLETLSLTLSGTQQSHRLDLTAIHEEAKVAISLSGAASSTWNAWSGQLSRGEIDVTSQNQFWRLNKPANLAYAETGELTFGNHCWVWEEASVCGGEQTLLPDPVLDYQVRNFPTTALSPILPEALRWDTVLNADLAFQAGNGGRKGSLSIDAGSGEFSVRNGEDWEIFQYEVLTSKAELLPEQAKLAVALSGPRLGTLSATLAVDPEAENRDVDGRFEIAGLDIAMAAVFAGLEEVKGKLNGEGRLSGPLLKPAVTGELALTGGEISDPALPMPLEDIVISLALNGYSADVSGRWKSSASSSGQLKGTLDWQSEPAVDLRLTGSRLPFTYEPYASVELEPDLNIVFRKGDLKISGRLAVPRGNIEITTLPEQAVSVSEDEVIVGAKREEETLRSLNMDVTVVVGNDQVSFNGFGVTGNLEGTLRIGNDMDTRGALQLKNGQYQKYGQELKLRRARLLFTGPLSQPYLDIEAIRRVDTVIAGLRVSGPVSAPQTEVFSEPPMPETDALSYLILGRAPRGQSEDGQMRNAAISMGLTQASKLTRGVGEQVGIRELTLESEGSGDGASVVASGYLTEDLSLRYGVGLFEPITTVALRYDLGRYFYLEAASGLAASLDIFYTRDF